MVIKETIFLYSLDTVNKDLQIQYSGLKSELALYIAVLGVKQEVGTFERTQMQVEICKMNQVEL